MRKVDIAHSGQTVAEAMEQLKVEVKNARRDREIVLLVFTALGRQVWEVRSRLCCRRSCLDWPDNMALRLMAMPTKIEFPESKTFTHEASTQDPRCSYSAIPNPLRTRHKTSVLTFGTYGRKSGFVPVQLVSGRSSARDNAGLSLSQAARQ